MELIQSKKTLLVPGEKGSWSAGKQAIAVEKVDTRIYTEWMTGEIVFRKATFKEMVTKLERSYNVTIESNNQALLDKKFNASFNKNIESIDEVLDAMSKIQQFSYQRKGNEIKIN